jgi:hypothetical protein
VRDVVGKVVRTRMKGIDAASPRTETRAPLRGAPLRLGDHHSDGIEPDDGGARMLTKRAVHCHPLNRAGAFRRLIARRASRGQRIRRT